MERLFEHHSHPHQKDEEGKDRAGLQSKEPHKESEKEKYMDWYHKEEDEEAEGETYGGLMWPFYYVPNQ